MSSLGTTRPVHNNRGSPRIANRHDSRDAPQPARACGLNRINQRALTSHGSGIPGISNDPSPTFGHLRPAQTVQYKDKIPASQRLCVEEPIPPQPSKPRRTKRPQSHFRTLTHPRQARSAPHSPLPQPLPLTSSPPKTQELRAISKSPRLSENSPQLIDSAVRFFGRWCSWRACSAPNTHSPGSNTYSPSRKLSPHPHLLPLSYAVKLYLPCKLLYTRSIRFVSGEVSKVLVLC
jgi:hypothetical protein